MTHKFIPNLNDITFIKYYHDENNYLCQFSNGLSIILNSSDFNFLFINKKFKTNKGYYLEKFKIDNDIVLLPSVSSNEVIKRLLNDDINLNFNKIVDHNIFTVVDKFPIHKLNIKDIMTITFNDCININFSNNKPQFCDKENNELGYAKLNFYSEHLKLLDILEYLMNTYNIDTEYISINEIINNILELIDDNEFDYINNQKSNSDIFNNKCTNETNTHKIVTLFMTDFDFNIKIIFDKTKIKLPEIELSDTTDDFIFVNSIYPEGNDAIYELNFFEPNNINSFCDSYITNHNFSLPVDKYFIEPKNDTANKIIKGSFIACGSFIVINSLLNYI